MIRTPFFTANMQIEGMYNRILRLDAAVELSPGTFLQYHTMEPKKTLKQSAAKTRVRKESERHCCDDSTFFDAYVNLPPLHEEFFYCFEEEEFEIMSSIRYVI
jgi:hypothetical protein